MRFRALNNFPLPHFNVDLRYFVLPNLGCPFEANIDMWGAGMARQGGVAISMQPRAARNNLQYFVLPPKQVGVFVV